MFSGIARADFYDGGGGGEGGSESAAGRGVQAAQFSVFVSGTRGRCAEVDCSEAGEKFKLLVISEVMEISQIPMMLPYVDILQVGARNMQNFNLLRELGKVRKPVLLKRGIAATSGRVAAVGGIHHGGRELRSDSVRAWDSDV